MSRTNLKLSKELLGDLRISASVFLLPFLGWDGLMEAGVTSVAASSILTLYMSSAFLVCFRRNPLATYYCGK